MIPVDSLHRLVESRRAELVAFAQTLIQTRSLSGQEGAVAEIIRGEMLRLGYDAAWIDAAGNVIGQIEGGPGPAVMFNGHIDHVEAGDPALWPHDPHAGEIHDGSLWGRGAADMKGAVAAMVYAGAMVKQLGVTLPGPLYVCGAVQEEVGGLGSRHLARTLPVARTVIGEASANHLRRGHRGRVELVAHWQGRSVHASMPHLGVNPHGSMARFVTALPGLPMLEHPDYGASTVAPTRTTSEPSSANVTPSALHLVLDWRNVPGEPGAEIRAKLEGLLRECLEPGCGGRVEIAAKELTTYTGLTMRYPDEFPSFTTAADDPYLLQARAALEAALGREVLVGTWRFATDGGHLAAAGATVIGFGPGDDTVVHTAQERLPVDQLVESVAGYVALALV